MPMISIIVPVYKTQAYIYRCIDSILVQTYKDFELILVDDGSPDNCGVICDTYAEKDQRVRVIHQENRGLSAARNAGIEWVLINSDSEWLTFIDSDDYVHPDMLKVLYEAADQNDTDVSVCAYEETKGEALVAAEGEVYIWKAEDFFLKHNVNATVAWGKLYRKCCFSDIRYPEGKVHEDEYVTYRIMFAAERIAVTDAKLYGYFFNDEGITKGRWTPRKMDSFDALEAQIEYYASNGYLDLARYRLSGYAWNIQNQIRRIQEEPLQITRRKYTKYCRRKLRHVLRAYSHVLRFTVIEHDSLFGDAYPALRPMIQIFRKIRIGVGQIFRYVFGESTVEKVRRIIYRNKWQKYD